MLGLSVALLRASSSVAIAPTCGRSFLRRHITSFPLQRTRKIGIPSRFPYVHARVQVVSIYTHTHTHTHMQRYRWYTHTSFSTSGRIYRPRHHCRRVCAYNVRILYIVYYRIVQRARKRTLRRRFLRVFRSRDPRTEIARGDPTRIIFERKSLHAQTTTTTRV